MDPNQPPATPPDQKQSDSTPKQSVVARIQQATNVLVTVNSDPSVDELAATIGFTLLLNKLGKHATAVFSGEVPSTLDFLKPEETLEANTDSLRDFIVSLDKAKADKLRYKVEENVVKIFITPYKTSLSQDDLEFTQGDFNVDVVVALGVTQREQIDQAIIAHGRILHDASVITVLAGQETSDLGQINWQDPAASSLSEMLVSISEAFQGGLIDEQIATAFLTGIVSETERFSNPKTSPKVMTMAAQLMAAGANQQLIANELEKAVEVDMAEPVADAELPPLAPEAADSADGSLVITHDEPEAPAPADETPAEEPVAPPSQQEATPMLAVEPLDAEEPEPKPEPAPVPLPPPTPEPAAEPEPEPEMNQIEIDHEGNLKRASIAPKHKVIQPLPSATEAEPKPEPAPAPPPPPTPEPTAPSGPSVLPPPPKLDLTPSDPIQDTTTLAQLEQAVGSPHQPAASAPDVDAARHEVNSVLEQTGFNPAGQARADLNAMPLGAPPAPTPFDTYRLPDAPPAANPVVDTGDSLLAGNQPASAPQPAPMSPDMKSQEPGGMALHTLGEVIPEGNQSGDGTLPPPPSVPPPMLPT